MKKLVESLVGLTSAMVLLGIVYGTDAFGLFNLTARLSEPANKGITALYLVAISQVAYWHLKKAATQ